MSCRINTSYMYENIMFKIIYLKRIGLFSSISIRCIFYKILGPSINNDNANLCIWSLLNLLKIVHIRKYLILLRNGMKPILKVLPRKYTNALSSFLLNIKIIGVWFWSWIKAMSLT
jgi:hypothetical protein